MTEFQTSSESTSRVWWEAGMGHNEIKQVHMFMYVECMCVSIYTLFVLCVLPFLRNIFLLLFFCLSLFSSYFAELC